MWHCMQMKGHNAHNKRVLGTQEKGIGCTIAAFMQVFGNFAHDIELN